jgi:ribosomal protein S27AE
MKKFMGVKMIELQDSRKSREDGHNYFDRTGSTGMTAEERKQRMEWYEQTMKAFNFNEPICPKCNNFTFFGIIHQEKGWQYYHCGCGFQAHKEIKLDRSDCGREDRTNKEHRPALKVMTESTCLFCGKVYQLSIVAKYKGRKYCTPCLPEVQRENKMGVKKGSYKPRVFV